jgi:hypothetical protein
MYGTWFFTSISFSTAPQFGLDFESGFSKNWISGFPLIFSYIEPP